MWMSKRCEVNSRSSSRKAVFTVNNFHFLSAYYYEQLTCLYPPIIEGRNKTGHMRGQVQPPHLSLKSSFTFAIFTCVLPPWVRHLENQTNQKTPQKKGRHAYKQRPTPFPRDCHNALVLLQWQNTESSLRKSKLAQYF